MSPSKLEIRLTHFTFVILLGFALIVGRMAQIQLVRGSEYQSLAESNRLRTEVLRPTRGIIYDRNGEVLATNKTSFTVSIRTDEADLDLAALETLAGILDMPFSDIEEKIARSEGMPIYQLVVIKRDIPPHVHTAIEERSQDLPGVVVDMDPMREYPKGSLASHVIGYLREIDREELARLSASGYMPGDMVGKTGIEALFDRELHGIHGGRRVEVDALGNRMETLPIQVDPTPGHNLVLTIDASLQDAAERALRAGLQALREHPTRPYPRAQAGTALVMDVRTGGILVMASIPDYDPNLFAGDINPSDWQALQGDSFFPLLNRAVAGEYQPGSIFKMVTAVAALETQKVYPGETFFCSGTYWRIPKRCWQADGHGTLSLVQAIAQSCNVSFYEMGYRTGVDVIADYARSFGLGQPTGLDFLPKEARGLVPDKEWKRTAYERGLVNDPQWYVAETLDVAIGQGFHQYTPLQVAVYVSALANGGQRLAPWVVREVVDFDGNVLRRYEPRVLGQAEVSEANLRLVQRGMLEATREVGTAASHFEDFPVPVAGKTGTVEQDPSLGKDYHGWFVGYAPFDEPEIAVVVLVEEGGSASRAAVPVARDILEAYFALEETRSHVGSSLP